MGGWCVLIEAHDPEGGAPPQPAVDALTKLLEPYAGQVVASPNRYSVSLLIDTESVERAVYEALATFDVMVGRSGAPAWPLVRIEALADHLAVDLRETTAAEGRDQLADD